MLWWVALMEGEMENRSKPPEWNFDLVTPAIDREGLPGVAMRVSRTADGGLPVFMHLAKAKRLLEELDATIKATESGDAWKPPFTMATMTKG